MLWFSFSVQPQDVQISWEPALEMETVWFSAGYETSQCYVDIQIYGFDFFSAVTVYDPNVL